MLYHIITYGCQMNKSDSERMATVLENAGYKKTLNINRADLIVVNACSVRQSAVDRIFGQARKFSQLRANNPLLKTILTGCVLEKDKKKLTKIFDLILNIQQFPLEILKDKAPRTYARGILRYRTEGTVRNPSEAPLSGAKEDKKNNCLDYFEIAPKYQSSFSACVPIMTGCNNFCSYCVVPYTRGCEVSRPAKKVLTEVKALIKNGCKEIWLLGQNVNSYNSFIITKKRKRLVNFPELLRIVNDIPGDFWIRFTSSHPKDFSDELIEAIAHCQKVTKYLNLPVQAGDNLVLKNMNRPYTVEYYKNLVKKIREKMPEITLSTDVIVGFPGETKKQFKNTVDLFKKTKFDMAYIAQYSPRPGTIAAKMKDDVSTQEKEKRWRVLTKVLEQSALEKNKKYLGKIVTVLPEQTINGNLIGKSESYKTIKFKGQKGLIGKFVAVRITAALPWGLKGEIAKDKKPKEKSVSSKMIIILGPTSSGKSALAVKLAKKFNGEVVSADSRQVYKGMDLGTGKITKKEMQGIPHHLLDVVSPKSRFTVSRYQKLALRTIKKIISDGKLPILCGGSGFYIQAVVNGIVIPEVAPDWKLRKELEQKTTDALYRKLKALDPERAKNIDRKNPRRLIRALEIIAKTKRSVPSLKYSPFPYPVLLIGIKKPKEELRNRIKKRLSKRLKQGMVAEVKRLRQQGLSWKKLEEFGLEYRYVSQYLQEKLKYNEMVGKLEKEIEHFAARQMTWFKRDRRIHWVDNFQQTERLVKRFLGK